VTDDLVPGEIRPGDGTVTLNEGRETAEVTVGNTGDRPVQVGSHFHFFEANAALEFDREAAFGMRLNIPAGTAVRFEPGDEQTVELVAIGGKRAARGMNGMVDGSVDADPSAALERLRAAGFGDSEARAERGPRDSERGATATREQDEEAEE
jgi:urease subunit beta